MDLKIGAQKTLKRLCKTPFKFPIKSVFTTFDHFPCIAKDDYDSMLLEATYDLLVGLRKPLICYPLF